MKKRYFSRFETILFLSSVLLITVSFFALAGRVI